MYSHVCQTIRGSGLSLDRLRALLEVGASGSIVKAAHGDPVRQSQYSRQIKELEDFFRIKLIERQGKGTRLTSSGKELARISRFFMLGLSNFKRGCLEEDQSFRTGSSATFGRCFLLPVLSSVASENRAAYTIEVLGEDEIERRLHDLTLDFGIIGTSAPSRPLQTKLLREWKLELQVPKALRLTAKEVLQALRENRLPLVLAERAMGDGTPPAVRQLEPQLVCDSFLEARSAAGNQRFATLLPDYLPPERSSSFMRVRIPELSASSFAYYLAWNPRLFRLNPHTAKERDRLFNALRSAAPQLSSS